MQQTDQNQDRCLNSSEWFAFPPDRVNLICLPQAGGDTSAFYRWDHGLQGRITMTPARLTEPPFRTMGQLVKALSRGSMELRKSRYVILSASMGAWVGYELCPRIKQAGETLPEMLVVLAAGTPFEPSALASFELDDRASAIQSLAAFNPDFTPAFEYPELVDLLLLANAADFVQCVNYSLTARRRIAAPMLAWANIHDDIVKPEPVEKRPAFTSAGFELNFVEDGPSFFERPPESLLALVRRHACRS